jgi:transposase
MDISTDSPSVSRLEVVNTGRRRRWTPSEKLRIVEESFSEPRHASETARRYGISNALLFSWRRTFREGRMGAGDVLGLVPAMIVRDPPGTAAPVGSGQMEIVSPNGWRVLVNHAFDEEALARLLRVLTGVR